MIIYRYACVAVSIMSTCINQIICELKKLMPSELLSQLQVTCKPT